MKLKKFNATNIIRTKKGSPTVRFSPKTGLISFSVEAGKMLGLSEGGGMCIELLQNEEQQKDWYIHVTRDEAGFPLRHKDGSHSFNNMVLCRAVIKSLEPARPLPGQIDVSKGATFLISSTPVEENGAKLWFIITNRPIV